MNELLIAFFQSWWSVLFYLGFFVIAGIAVSTKKELVFMALTALCGILYIIWLKGWDIKSEWILILGLISCVFILVNARSIMGPKKVQSTTINNIQTVTKHETDQTKPTICNSCGGSDKELKRYPNGKAYCHICWDKINSKQSWGITYSWERKNPI